MDGIFRTELLFFQLGDIKRSVFTQHTMGEDSRSSARTCREKQANEKQGC